MLHFAPHALHSHHIAIGNEIDLLIILCPKIIVFAHQQHIIAHQFVLSIQNAIANPPIKNRRTLIAARHHNGLAHAITVIAIANGFKQKLSRDGINVGKTLQLQPRRSQLATAHHIPQNRGIKQNTTLRGLTHNLRQTPLTHP